MCNPSPITVLPSAGPTPAVQVWQVGATQFPLQSRNQTGRRELRPGIQRYPLHGGCHSTAKRYIARQTRDGKPPYTVAIKLLKGAQHITYIPIHLLIIASWKWLSIHCMDACIGKCMLCTFSLHALVWEGGAGEREVENFLEEIAMMKKVFSGECCHVVQLVGCVSTALPLALALEFVPFGDLLSYLHYWREKVKPMTLYNFSCNVICNVLDRSIEHFVSYNS